MTLHEFTVVIVPGLRDHVAEHWQTHLQAALPRAVTVPPLEQDKLSRAARVQALDAVLSKVQGPVLLAAHSAGCMIVAHWAQQCRRPIRGALLAAPADLESPLPAGYPALDALREHGWLPTPRAPLPFPSIVGASSNDPLGDYVRIQGLAHDWNSQLVNLGAVGHLNPVAGYGPWPQARTLIEQLL